MAKYGVHQQTRLETLLSWIKFKAISPYQKITEGHFALWKAS